MKVFVYFNLHKKVWSIKALEGERKGRVIAHKDFVILGDAKAKVSEAGRQRVLRERKKNVHAGLVGEWLNNEEGKLIDAELLGDCINPHMVVYNPYKYKTFVYRSTHIPWREKASMALLNAEDRGVMVFTNT
jgi:hypothetical protein